VRPTLHTTKYSVTTTHCSLGMVSLAVASAAAELTGRGLCQTQHTQLTNLLVPMDPEEGTGRLSGT